MSFRDPTGGLSRLEALDYTLVVLGAADEVPPGYLLGASRLSLGAGEADDVYLAGVGVAPGHVRLVFLDGLVTLLSASEEVRIDGVVVASFPAELQPLQTLSLSPDTHLSYGAVGSKWPVPPHWQVEEASAPEEIEAPPLPDEVEPDRPLRVQRTVKQKVVHSAQMGSVVLGVASLLLVGMVLVNLIWGSREVVNPGEVAIDRAEQALQAFVARDPARYASVRVVRRNDGAIALTGFMDSEEAYREMADQVRQQLVSSGGNVRLDAVTRERLDGLIRDQISRYPLGSYLEITPEAIRLNVYGIQTDAVDPPRLLADLSRLRDRVKPRPMFIEMDLEPAQVVTAEITDQLVKSPITREFQISVGETGGGISGVVAPAAEAEARSLLEALKKTYGQRLPLTFDIKVDPKLNFNLVGLTLGGEAASATLVQRGRAETFRVGDEVFGNGELKEIRSNGVVVGLGRRELFIPMASR
jgi:hypothetical protein